MKNYDEKFRFIFQSQSGRCVIADADGEYRKMDALHHLLSKSKWAVRKYPLFIDSICNLVGVNNELHISRNSAIKAPEWYAVEWERFFEHNPECAEYCNNPDTVIKDRTRRTLVAKTTEVVQMLRERTDGRIVRSLPFFTY